MNKLLEKCNWYNFQKKYKNLTIKFGIVREKDSQEDVGKSRRSKRKVLKTNKVKIAGIEYEWPQFSYGTLNIATEQKKEIPKINVCYNINFPSKNYNIYVNQETCTFEQKDNYTIICKNTIQQTLFKNSVFVKIKDYKKSSEIFGYRISKKNMMESGKNYLISEMHENYECKKDGKIRDIFEINNGVKTLKFVFEDLEFVYPDIDKLIKGYNLPKNRTIKKNSDVVLVRNKGINVPIRTKGTVKEIIVGNILYYDVNFGKQYGTHRIKYGKLKII